MSLAEAPLATQYEIRLTRCTERSDARYVAAGVGTGALVRVMARYPGTNPRFLELEIDGARYVTVPMDFASSVTVAALPQPAGGAS